jgi:hypothetical protein
MPPPADRVPRVDTTILGAASLLALAMGGTTQTSGRLEVTTPPAADTEDPTAGLVGVWLSADGAVRLELDHDGTYERSVAGRRRSSHGSYLVDGTSVLLHDDNGLRTVMTVADGELDMAGHRLHRI